MCIGFKASVKPTNAIRGHQLPALRPSRLGFGLDPVSVVMKVEFPPLRLWPQPYLPDYPITTIRRSSGLGAMLFMRSFPRQDGKGKSS